MALLGGAFVAYASQRARKNPIECAWWPWKWHSPMSDDGQRLAAAFEQSLRQLGWTPGRNVRIEYRWDATNAERAETDAAELVSSIPTSSSRMPP